MIYCENCQLIYPKGMTQCSICHTPLTIDRRRENTLLKQGYRYAEEYRLGGNETQGEETDNTHQGGSEQGESNHNNGGTESGSKTSKNKKPKKPRKSNKTTVKVKRAGTGQILVLWLLAIISIMIGLGFFFSGFVGIGTCFIILFFVLAYIIVSDIINTGRS